MSHMMSRRTFHLSLIVLGIILLNGLAFAGNAQEMAATERAMTCDAAPAVAVATIASMQDD